MLSLSMNDALEAVADSLVIYQSVAAAGVAMSVAKAAAPMMRALNLQAPYAGSRA